MIIHHTTWCTYCNKILPVWFLMTWKKYKDSIFFIMLKKYIVSFMSCSNFNPLDEPSLTTDYNSIFLPLSFLIWHLNFFVVLPHPETSFCLFLYSLMRLGSGVSAGSLGFITLSRVESCVPEGNRCVDHLHLYTSTGFSLPTQKVQTPWQSMQDSCVSLFAHEISILDFPGSCTTHVTLGNYPGPMPAGLNIFSFEWRERTESCWKWFISGTYCRFCCWHTF